MEDIESVATPDMKTSSFFDFRDSEIKNGLEAENLTYDYIPMKA